MNAGYNEQQDSSKRVAKDQQVAYAEKRHYGVIGELHNNCLTKERFDSIKDLLLDDVTDKWRTGVHHSKDSSEIAKMGVVVPKNFIFGGRLSFQMQAMYTKTDSSSSDKMSKALHAGIKVLGNGASTEVEEAFEKATSEQNIKATYEIGRAHV